MTDSPVSLEMSESPRGVSRLPISQRKFKDSQRETNETRMFPIPLQVIDGFLLKVNFGDALIVGFVLGLFAVATQRSRKLLTLYLMAFGALFLLTPASMNDPDKELALLNSVMQYKTIGLVLLVISPVLYTTAQK